MGWASNRATSASAQAWDLSLGPVSREQHQLPRPVVAEHAIQPSRAAASNATIFRAAQAESAARGLALEVELIP